MKVIMFNGSPQKNGNTANLLGIVAEQLNLEGVVTELIHLGGHAITGCIACWQCWKRKDGKCALNGDKINEYIEKMREADAIIFGSPTYTADITPELKALIDRASLVSIANGGFFQRKIGAGVIAVRRGGAIHAFDTINHFFLINQMIVVGSCYWNMGVGLNAPDWLADEGFQPKLVSEDEEGITTMKKLGENMAWLMKQVCK